jgi:NAD(P)-dependent dehydrogenase (short-subunit alcohol dehydrogenase family)
MPLALITGGAKRIGAIVAVRLAKAGFDIALHVNHSSNEGKSLIETIHQHGVRAQLFCLDLNLLGEIESMFDNIHKSMGPIDVVVNNASMFVYDSPDTLDYVTAEKQLRVNLLAPAEITRCLARDRTSQALVINMLDNKLFALNPDYFSYTLSKAGLKSATEMMAMKYAGKLRINAIAPGVTLQSGEQSRENFEQGHKNSLSGTGATPDDIADTVLFMWNTKSINGETIILDGGQHLLGLNRDVAFLGDN